MAMIEPSNDDRGGLAAEYALGTLDGLEKAQAEALLRSDAAFAAEVEDWRRRLDPLLEAPPAAPPAGVLGEIFAAIGAGDRQPSAEIIQLHRRLAAWRWAAAAATALAASLIVFAAFNLPAPRGTPPYIAVLESPDRKVAFVATADLEHGGLSVQRVGLPPAPGRSFELWAIWEGAPPKSLGVVHRNAGISAQILNEKTGGQPLANILLAITDELEGGSTDGKPGGPPIFSGKLIQAPAL
jgi:anti-sigma-K factor RskA